MMLLALAVFILMYVLIIALPRWRVLVVLAAAAVYIASGIVPPGEVLGLINWNVLFMIAGTMIVVYYFIESGMPARIADTILISAKNVAVVTISMSLFSGAVSAFIDNVATVLMIAPVALAVCRKLKISPVPMLISISVSSNLQGAATLVGDTTSILLGAYANMDFLDFFFMNGRPGMFFAVELGALATIPVMMILFRNDKQPVSAEKKTPVDSYVPSILLCLIVVLLILVSFIKDKPETTNGLICLGLGIAAMIWDAVRRRQFGNARLAVLSLDAETLLLLTGLFIAVGGISNAGVIGLFASGIIRAGGSSLFLLYTIIVWGSVALSAFIDNIPYVLTMLPVITDIAAYMGIDPTVLYFGLLCGATLGGNLTPVGASANITAVGLLKREGEQVSFGEFFRIGGTFTLTAVFVGYVFIWVFWH